MLCSQFAAPVFGIGLRGVALTDLFIGLLLPDGTKHAEAAHEDQSLQGHLYLQQSVHQILGALGVDAPEVLFVQTLRHTSGMHHVVEGFIFQLLFQLLLRREVQFDEVDALVFQPFPRTALTHGSPGLEAPAKGFLHDK